MLFRYASAYTPRYSALSVATLAPNTPLLRAEQFVQHGLELSEALFRV